jgi:hypothetical protein
MNNIARNSLFTLCLSLIICDLAYAARVALPRTGQTFCYDPANNNAVTACAGTGQDGDKLKGASWPIPRFTDNIVGGVSNGTVTDNLTGLIWLKDANCLETSGGIAKASGKLTWADALTWSNNLSSGSCGLTDGSTAGQWRLPNINELESLVDISRYSPALPSDQPFGTSSVLTSFFWSGSTYAGNTASAWLVFMGMGQGFFMPKTNSYYVWSVRAGQ